jgi:membrane protease YdiL (CAAX protease family)
VRTFLKQQRLVAFFVLAFALSWYPWILALMRGRTSGPNPLGPLVAAIILTAIADGRVGLREFFSRLVRWRVGGKWYAVTFGTPILVCLIAVALTLCFVPRGSAAVLSIEHVREVPERFLFILLFIGLGEEPGWRGFALPELQTKYSPLRASLILAPIWTLWHLPLIGNEFPGPIVAPFILSVFGATFMLTWVFNGTKGSVLLPMLFHGFDTNPEFGGDLFVGFTLGNQLKHSFFAGSQAYVFPLSQNGGVRCVLIVLAKVLGDRWAEKTLSLVHLANGFDENVG